MKSSDVKVGGIYGRLTVIGAASKKAHFDCVCSCGNKGVLYTALGKTLNLVQWSKLLNMATNTLWSRIKNGWTLEAAFSTQLHPRKYQSRKSTPRA